MKYDILVQTFTSSLVRKQYLPKLQIIFFKLKINSKLKRTQKKVKKEKN